MFEVSNTTSVGSFVYGFWPKAMNPGSGDTQTVERIQETVEGYKSLTDQVLRDRANLLRMQWEPSQSPDRDMIVASFALLVESLRRTLGISLYQVQILAGLALVRKTIAEMQTGEGKTFAAALPAFTYSLSGRGVHSMTVNAYLAKRDYELLLPAYKLLGVSAGCLPEGGSPDERRAAYACDITYGPGYDFGFDYLRDQVALLQQPKRRLGESFRQVLHGHANKSVDPIQRGHHFAIVDEADSVMIDEAMTPLILSGCSAQASPHPALYRAAMEVADRLEEDHDYVCDVRQKAVHLTERGMSVVRASTAQIPEDSLQRPWSDYVDKALRAKVIVKKDIDYVIEQDAVLLVDANTGRIFADRSWRDGLRQAVEAREGIPITSETRSVAHISRQRYLGFYEGLCGLTGTAAGSEREFWQVYHVPVVAIPLRTPSQRTVLSTRFFLDQKSKWSAIVEEIDRIHPKGQPLLVGTRTIEDSELLADELRHRNIPFHLLNGKQDADEAKIVARAGEKGTVTVATNMAGRGTDIRLGDGVRELGGLHVIGCEQQECARVDRQLIGRCARQGDPGSCQLFASAEDSLLAANSPHLVRRMKRLAQPDGEVHANLSSEVARIQQQRERHNFSARRQLLAHDHWIE
ncbi:MAG: preprotein translocase subunit SecA [Planctomycetia bacterium]|jgi:preprotein translocase subunit SecA